MNPYDVKTRITELRKKKGVSEYKMSLDLGHSKGYIQSISSGKASPSIREFLNICEYLGVTPKDFFDFDLEEPMLIERIQELSRKMSKSDLEALIVVAERLANE
ncbi:MAG: helix-turn-helix transcriptional regulator [Lachnospiraceae bacterium]|nr:helix-turn-helix transcriptional regulator [Lachnospiraceae bacterium]